MDAKGEGYKSIDEISFNPRARDGREEPEPVIVDDEFVSIHAPVMDAKNLSQ